MGKKDSPGAGFRLRTVEAFLATVRKIYGRHSLEAIAVLLGTNKWHIWQIVNNPYYKPSKYIRRKLNLVPVIRPRRVAVHTTDVESAFGTLTNPKNFEREYLRELVDRVLTEYLYRPYEGLQKEVMFGKQGGER